MLEPGGREGAGVQLADAFGGREVVVQQGGRVDFVVGGRGVFACVLENHFNALISPPIDRLAAAIAIAVAIASSKLAGVCK